MNYRNNAMLIRMGQYDMTQAVPRAASTLQELGYNITILALDRFGNKPDNENLNGWQIVWFHHRYESGNKISFMWAWFCWWVWVIRKICRGNYNLVQASNLESIVPCVLAKAFKNFKLIFDVRDPWGMNSSNSGSFMMRTFKTIERWAAARVDGIVLSQGILERTGLYFGKKVCSRIPSVQVLNVPGQDMAGKFVPPDTNGIRLNFSGHISYVRNAQAIIDLASKKPEMQVDVVGEIRDEKLLLSLKAISNIKLYGQLPFDRAMKLLQDANIISVMYDTNTEVAIVSSANKMFEAMMMSRPYIASKGGFPGIIAEHYGIGWAVPYGDSNALIELVSQLLAEPEKIKLTAKKSREVYQDNFTWDKQKANLILLYKYVAENEKKEFVSHAGWDKMLGTVL
jgi:glycosyltransferase involved in cell wall biosynthesis